MTSRRNRLIPNERAAILFLASRIHLGVVSDRSLAIPWLELANLGGAHCFCRKKQSLPSSAKLKQTLCKMSLYKVRVGHWGSCGRLIAAKCASTTLTAAIQAAKDRHRTGLGMAAGVTPQARKKAVEAPDVVYRSILHHGQAGSSLESGISIWALANGHLPAPQLQHAPAPPIVKLDFISLKLCTSERPLA
jgi:hypothetical protein